MSNFQVAYNLIDSLASGSKLTIEEFMLLLEAYQSDRGNEVSRYARNKAAGIRDSIYGRNVYVRGLIEISNICKNDCLYCGIRKSNSHCDRYRLTKDEILERVHYGYSLGIRTIVMQSGEDAYYTDEVLVDIISSIKEKYDVAVTLSLGEREDESYQRLYDAGADRYLLRHETADEEHYSKLHPDNMSWSHRMDCLNSLRRIGYQVGCGFMVGSPYQNNMNLAKDLVFIQKFQPDMCGIGPFIPHKDTPFACEKAGSVELTCFLLALIRLICPNVLLPATTALATLSSDGRIKGLLSGANVIMPNLSPEVVRSKYTLYDNKANTGLESLDALDSIKSDLEINGFVLSLDKGDRVGFDRKKIRGD